MLKRKFLIVLTIILINFSVLAQNSSEPEDIEKFKQKNQQIISLFKANEFKEAEIVSREALDLAKKVFGKEAIETADSYRNLGEILRMRKEYEESVTNFDSALAIYKKDDKKNALSIIAALESKATVLAFEKKKNEAREVFVEHLSVAEKHFGKDSEKLLPYLKTQTDFYLFLKDFDQADEMIIRRRIIALRANDKSMASQISDETTCYLYQNLSFSQIQKRQAKIFKAVSEEVNLKPDKVSPKGGEVKRISGGVINGKAKRLAKPDYPPDARAMGARGTVLVRLTIDESGKVIEAKAFCGHPRLRKAGEEAAFRSSFKPTKLNGKTVEVVGIIIYTFQ